MKTSLRTLFFLLLLCTTQLAFGQNWQLVWADEFTNGISPDWVFETGTGSGGWGNNELQYYRRENATVSNGQLVITARRENYEGMNYTSARMKTQGKKSFKYGRIEARIAMPSFQGVWPAFWMLGENISSVGWPNCGEIDIMEHVNTGGEVHGTIHWSNQDGNYSNYGGSTSTSMTSYHTYTVEWTPDYIKWFVDGVQYHEVNIQNGVNGTSEFHNNHFILLNMAIGGNWPGFTVDNSAFPANMYVDYVRVYQQSTTPTGDPNLSGTYYLQNRHSGLYLEVANGSTADGANLQQWSHHGGTNQHFEFAHLGSGTYRITPKHSGKSMDVSNVSTADGANVHQWSYVGGANQQFIAQSTGDGFYKLIAKHSNKLVEVGGFSTSNGGNVQQWSAGSQASGQWKLVPVTLSFNQTIQAESYSTMSGVQTESTTDIGGGMNVGWIDAGDWMAYNSINIPATGNYQIEYRVASPGGGQLSLDLNAGAVQLGTVSIPATGGWQSWTTVSQTVKLNAGTYNFGIYAQTGGWNFNWFRISSQGTATSRIAQTGEVTASTESEPSASNGNIRLYPNPATSVLHVIAADTYKGGTYTVLNQIGMEIFKGSLKTDQIDVTSLEAGFYILVLSKEGSSSTRRFIKQ